ncbi:hypothetical protein B9Z55_011521 [Caenorhabditis nigoni]|uniref:Uncharacterized protein n=1 Tax=Caenorhabditis nigoni TaxID=1611254 RepID=A0A2G5ULC8_9PELO|nr:hypothetical protein B9Z55_011521 [Caenorhabditis nigoni]
MESEDRSWWRWNRSRSWVLELELLELGILELWNSGILDSGFWNSETGILEMEMELEMELELGFWNWGTGTRGVARSGSLGGVGDGATSGNGTGAAGGGGAGGQISERIDNFIANLDDSVSTQTVNGRSQFSQQKTLEYF